MISANISLSRPSGFSLDVSLEIGDGVTALYGPSGSGKTTILRLIAGLERGGPADLIDVSNDGTVWHSETGFLPTHKRRVGYVFQQPQLFPHLNVRDNLRYGRKRGTDNGVEARQVYDWLDLDSLLDQRVARLSGGEAQRVAIGRVLLSDARCILMDEPLGSIDQSARNRILPYLDRLHRELDVPMVYVSHSLDEVNYLADRVYLLQDGHVRASGTVFETSASLEINRDEGEGLAAVIDCAIRQYDEAFGLTELAIGSHPLFVAARIEGERCRVRIPAKDVSIARNAPSETSILNIIPATVDDISASSHPSALVRLRIDGQFILARITRKSLATLELHEGQQIYAQIKGVALLTDYAR
jgi:molybdate transport system ATP-binding protein